MKNIFAIFYCFFSCALPWDIVEERETVSRLDKKILIQEGDFKPCQSEFSLTRMQIKHETERKIFFAMAENSECALYFEFFQIKEEYFLDNAMLLTNEKETIFKNLKEKIILTDLSGGKKITIKWTENNTRFSFDLYLKKYFRRDIFYELK
ncbi:MAG: hypothetical protein OEZ13_04620 [Spirochaetia bacterium]|nr:hypothetical protein [Spirochaetia bacterium]